MSAANNITVLLTDLFFSLVAFFFLLRAVLAFTGASFYNPVSQSIFTITNPVLRLIRPVAPFVGRIDFGCWGLAYLAKILNLFIIAQFYNFEYGVLTLAISALARLFETLVYIYIIALIILAVSSWFGGAAQSQANPVLSLLRGLTEPLLDPIRRMVPRTGVIDFSPMLALVGLYIVLILINSLAP